MSKSVTYMCIAHYNNLICKTSMEKKVPIYVRVKRLNQTYFVLCDEYENCSAIYDQVAAASGNLKEKMKIFNNNKVCASHSP